MTTRPEAEDRATVLQRALAAVKDLRARLAAAERARREPIAVIGMGCRFPGGANDPDGYWRLLSGGVDAVRPIPADRWDADAWFDPDPQAAGKASTRSGAFLDGVDRFDAGFFHISPREAVSMDPQQRLLLEVAWEALERAGQRAASLEGSRTGVFVGVTHSDYAQVIRRGGPGALDPYFATGNALNGAAGRLSYVLGLQGPSLAVDTACSSSLVAVHLAAQSLRSGDCRMALAGGVNLMLLPDGHVAMSRVRALAPDGRCKTFDARADGYGRGEGCGVVVLKRLSDARADGDPIQAVIRGSAVLQDGKSGGLTVPNGAAQQAVIRAALADAGVAPAAVSYVEAHGTGTSLGDPIEVRALGAVLGEGRDPRHPLLLGSVKTNIGHLESAAGIAGLVKVVLALRHRQIPPHLHLRELNPDVAQEPMPKRIPTTLEPWPGDAPRIAGVSAFGFSGTLAHVVVEEAPEAEAIPPVETRDEPQLVPLSAHSPDALRDLARSCADLLSSPDAPPLRDLAFTASLRRTHHDHRLGLVASERGQLSDLLQAFLAGEARPGLAAGVRSSSPLKVAFVFPGQGGQWPGMARDLVDADPAFSGAIDDCEHALRPHVEWSLREVLSHPAHPLLDRIDVLQPVLFSVQVALAASWRALGVTPDAVVGHSMGEVASAVTAGALTLTDAARIMARRSALLRRISGQGAMALVELPLADAQRELRGIEHLVAVAASNGPTSTILSGDPAALSELLARLGAREIFCRPVKVDVASHSPQVDPLREELLAALEGVTPAAASLPFLSTVTGARAEGTELDAGYWVQNLRRPVLFAPAIDRLLQDGATLFLEISPHPTLLASVQQLLRARSIDGVALPSLRRDEPGRPALLSSLAALHCLGYPVDFSRLHAGRRRCVSLPSYPWQRERFWVDPGNLSRRGGDPRTGAAALLGDRLRSPALSDEVFESELSVAELPYLADHRIAGEVVVPGASHVARVLCAAERLFGSPGCLIEDVAFPSALLLKEGERRTAQLIVAEDGAFRTVTSPDAGAEGGDWTVHAVGRVRKAAGLAARAEAVGVIEARCTQERSGASFYEEMAGAGYHLGPTFQWIDTIRSREGEALARMRPPRSREEAQGFPLFPGLLDSCWQLVAATSAGSGPAAMAAAGFLYVPTAVKRLVLHRRPEREHGLLCHVQLAPGAELGAAELAATIRLLDDDGPLLAVEFRGRRVDREVFVHGPRPKPSPFLRLAWEPAEPLPAVTPAPGRQLLIADRGGVAAHVAGRLAGLGTRAAVVNAAALDTPEGARRAIAEALAGPEPLGAVVHLGSLDALPATSTTLASLAEARAAGSVALLHLVQALAQAAPGAAPRLYVVTSGAQGAQGEVLAPAQAPVWGLARVVSHEHPELRCTCIDLGSRSGAVLDALARELVAGDAEDQVCLRADRRLVARLVAHALSAAGPPPPSPEALAPAEGRPLRLEIDQAGVLENLKLRAIERRPPGPGEVEIEVRAGGINFVDVLSAMGIRPDHAAGPIQLGGECAGVVSAIGAGVRSVRPGDAVVAALVPRAFSSFVTVPERCVVAKPAHLGFEDAATLPITFMTAHWAMHHKGRLARGERILIHAAAGGVGLAAVQLARRAGAEVFATAGSDEKRAYLRALGIEHVFDSRSLAFADEIRACTGGEGVDAVLNCLTGEALTASLGVLRAHGRFLEIGKRDIYDDHRLGLYPFHQNLSYFAVDLIRMFADRPDRFAELFREVIDLADRREIAPLPWRAFPIAQATSAFRHLAQAQHIGKVVLTFPDAEARLSPAVPPPPDRFRPDASYLLTGGLGGLGLAVARWMVDRGARHLALAGRTAPGPDAARAIAELEASGARVLVVRADVAQAGDVRRLLARIDAALPPLRGVVHAAGVLDDGVLLHQTAARLAAVMAPKVEGAWNLHAATRDRPLDLFVLFSGAGTLLGSPGQGGYAAANAFLDALAQARRAEGLPAQSIAWGPWSEIGLAARDTRGGRLALRGVGSLSPADALDALREVLADGAPHLAVLPLDLRQCFGAYPALATAPLFARLARGATGDAGAPSAAPFRQTLTELPPGDRRPALQRHLVESAARVLGLAPGRIDVRAPLGSLGFDSLMTLELRNRLEASLGLKLSATVVWSYPTVTALADHLARKLALSAEPDPPAGATALDAGAPPAAPATGAAVEELSDDEAAALLAARLDHLEERSAR